MEFFEDIKNGKYNLVLILILFVLSFHQYWSKSTEHMADVSLDTNIKEAIKQVYNADVEAIRNLSEVATKLQAGGLTIPGNLTVTGDINSQGNLTTNGNILSKGNMAVEGGNINLGNKEKDQWVFHAPADDRGLLSISRVQTDGTVNWSNGLTLLTSADGKQNLGGNFNLIPRGTIVSWTGTTAPAGWILCDGANGSGTPDLRGRFILGFGQGTGLSNRPMGQAGGEEAHTLNINEIPAHRHNFGRDYWTRDLPANAGVDLGNIRNQYANDSSGETTFAGGSQPHNNMPPFYVLAYIMKL